jgi:hypothetical protein
MTPRAAPEHAVQIRTDPTRPAARLAALGILGEDGDQRRLITQPDGSVIIANHPDLGKPQAR